MSCERASGLKLIYLELEALHGSEPVRFIRAPEDMLPLLRARALHCRPAGRGSSAARERIVGYLCVAGPDDRTGTGVIVAREIAGSRHAILAAARRPGGGGRGPSADRGPRRGYGDGFPRGRLRPCSTRATRDARDAEDHRPAGVHRGAAPRFLRGAPRGHAVFTTEMMQVTAAEDLAAAVFGSVERSPPKSFTPCFPCPSQAMV